jgi:hypothetical protein
MSDPIKLKLKAILESNDIVPGNVEILGPGEIGSGYKENLTAEQAKEMLENYPDGILKHDILEFSAFVFLTNSGQFGFYSGEHDDNVEPWDWKTDLNELAGYGNDDGYDPYNDWAYLPSTEIIDMTNGGIDFWNHLKSITFTKNQPILEAPVAGHENVGDFEKSSSWRKPVDRKLVSSDAGIHRIKQAFKNTDQDFYFYFVNTPKANRHTEVGSVSLDWVRENLDEEVYTKLAADMEEAEDWNSIFVIYTNNKGTAWRPMTPWIMAHRFGHAVARYNLGARSQRQFPAYGEFNRSVNTMVEELLHIGFDINFDATKIENFWGNDNSVRRTQLMFKNFCQAHLTFKSARDKNLREWFEVYNELIAQSLITGATPIKTEPQPFKMGNSVMKPKEMSSEEKDDFRNMAEMYARDINDYYIHDILTSAVGRILVM